MSDTPTLTVYEKCKHGRLEPHTQVSVLCPGGREIVLFETSMLAVVTEPGHFDGMRLYAVEVSDV